MLPSNLKKLLIVSQFYIRLDNLPINLNILILKCKTDLDKLPENLKILDLRIIPPNNNYTLEELVNLPRNLEKISIDNLNYNSIHELVNNYPY